MKKLFVLQVFIILSIILNGQITIKSSDFAPSGSIFEQITDTNNYAVNIKGTGQQTWDFSDLSTGKVDTFRIISPVSAPNFSDFQNSDYVVKINGQDTSVIFQYMKASDSLLIYGMTFIDAKKDSAIESISPSQYLGTIPMTYNPTDVHVNSYVKTDIINYSNSSGTFKEVSYITDSSKIDAYGMLSLPNFKNLNSLRISIISHRKDTTFYIDASNNITKIDSSESSDKSYIWFTNDSRIKFRVLQINTNAKDTSIEFIKTASVATHLNSYNNKNKIEIYPNPAKTIIRLSNIPKTCNSIDIINAEGKKLKHINKNQMKKAISISNLNSGIYLLRFNNTNLSKKLLIE